MNQRKVKKVAERVNLFGKTVADNLLQRDPKDRTLIKNKTFHMFFDYEQGNLTPRSTRATPFNNYGNFSMDTPVKSMHNSRKISQV